MKNYAAPLRLTWDWDWPQIAHPGAPPRRPSPQLVRAIGAEIVRARVLMLEVGYPDPEALLSGELAAALDGFEGSVSLVLAPRVAAELAGRKPWKALGAEEVWLDVTPGVGTIPEGLASWPALRFYLTAGNLAAVAAEIERAAAAGVNAISLPNLPLFGDVLRAAGEVTPDLVQLTGLAGRIATALHGRPPVDLRVHHYGLWQALRAAGVHPQGEESPGSGCQAGSALAYIDPAGILYPCASLPVPLARMGDGAVAEAWSGAALAALRENLARLPDACTRCALEPTCRGGCRGWSHYLSLDWNATGPDCTRP
ncbi:MAG: SPASM domain-containing protein [Candidatus Methylomirabilia bacterium]